MQPFKVQRLKCTVRFEWQTKFHRLAWPTFFTPYARRIVVVVVIVEKKTPDSASVTDQRNDDENGVGQFAKEREIRASREDRDTRGGKHYTYF